MSLEFFLNYEGAGTPIKWVLTDCLGQTGSPSIDHRSDPDMCVEADFAKDQTDVAVLVPVGTFQKGLSGVPAFFSANVTGRSRIKLALRRLGDLPKDMHRPVREMPRDLLLPVTAYCFF